MKRLLLLLALYLPLCIFSQNNKPYTRIGIPFKMVDPIIDDSEKEWCYAPKSTVVIGMPFAPGPVQVLHDASIFTGKHELCFFYGINEKTINARQRTFLDGWLPIVQYDWIEDDIHYYIEFFSTSLPELGNAKNTLQLAKFKAVNESSSARDIQLHCGTRRSGLDHRQGTIKEEKDISFLFKDRGFFRNGMFIFSSSPKGMQWTQSISDLDKKPKNNVDKVVGKVTYQDKILPGKSIEFTCAFPRIPLKDQKTINKVAKVSFKKERKKIIEFWTNLVAEKSDFQVPESRVTDSYKAGLVHLILATRNKGKKRQGSGLPYDGLFLNDFVDMRLAYDFANLDDIVEPNFEWLIDQQTESGMFIDKSLSHGKEILASHGQALYSMVHHYIINKDLEYGKRVLPYVKKAVDWMINDTKANEYGLLRTSWPYDNEMINGHYTSHNLWGILAIRTSIRYARELGEMELADKWMQFHDRYKNAISEALANSVVEDYYVPVGLYSYDVGQKARAGFMAMRTNQDWENNLLIYPTELLSANDERVAGTVDYIRKKRYREGVMTYRNGMHLHQYITINQANQYLAINNQKQALLDLYHVLLHNGSCHEGFENLVEPWEDRDPWPCPPPHGWAAAKISLFIRNCLVREFGGDAGLDMGQRGLHLYSLISPAWCKNGERIEIKNAGTEFGKVNSICIFKEDGAKISINSSYSTNPSFIAIAIPYHKQLKTYTSNAQKHYEKNGYLFFSADVTEIDITWDDKADLYKNNYQNILKTYRSERDIAWEADKVKGNENADAYYKMSRLGARFVMLPPAKAFLLPEEEKHQPEQLSFDLVRRCFQKEYTRRYQEFVSKKD